ncbi:MAG: transglutaminase family protein [Pseudomonadota bacterium]
MLLSVRHRTHYTYDPIAQRVALRLKLFPADCSSQTVRSWTVTVNGEAPDSHIVNGYGDGEAIWMGERTEEVEVIAEGLIETRGSDGVLRNWQMAARPAMFLRPTSLTEPGEEIRDLAAGFANIESGLERAHALSAAVRDAIDYRPGSTTATTTAVEAMRQGAGVCQDHAHVLIAAARSLGAAARYVVGYLFVGDDVGSDLIHQAETHAWAEIWIDNLGWVGFDPSNRICPTDHYIRIASGLDAPDAAPLRGSVTGNVDEALEAEVQVRQSQQ